MKTKSPNLNANLILESNNLLQLCLICQKAKPKGVAKLGQAVLYYHADSGCFYERKDPSDFSQRFFAGDLKQ